MLLPASSRLQDVAADHGLGKANLAGSSQRVAHHRLGLVEVADLNTAHGLPLGAALSSGDLKNIAPNDCSRAFASRVRGCRRL
jgi:hypothetical protein